MDRMIADAVDSPHPEDSIAREVEGKWMDVATDHPLGQKRVKRITNEMSQSKVVDRILVNDVYCLNLYMPLDQIDPTVRYVGGMDFGGNLARDFSTLTIIDPRTFEVIATLRSN